METRVCTKCRRTLSLDAYSLNRLSKTILRRRCDQCYSSPAARWTSLNPSKAKEAAKRHRESGKARAHRLRTRNGIDPLEYDRLFFQQQGKCAICGTEKPGGNSPHFHIDHNHESGKIRGLLCTNCNRGIGYFSDNIRRMRRAIEYLELSR